MFGLKIFVRVQTFRQVPPVLPCNFCHPASKTFDDSSIDFFIHYFTTEPLPPLKTSEVYYHESLPLKTKDQRLSPLYIAPNLFTSSMKYSLQVICGGTLIDNSNVLSAAHCFDKVVDITWKVALPLSIGLCNMWCHNKRRACQSLRFPENKWRSRTQVKGLANADTIRVGETDLNIGGEGGGHR